MNESVAEQAPTVLVADDDAAIRALLVDLLQSEGYKTLEAKAGTEVMRLARSSPPDLLILDLRMPDLTGIEIMRRLRDEGLSIPVLLITAYGTASTAIQAIQLGAYDYIIKPFEIDDVALRVRRFFEHERLASEVRKLRARLEGRDPSERIIGQNAAMQEVYKTVGRVAQSTASVLITGETGTGKELIADVIHQFSEYRKGPIIKVNLTALPETLVESELFGHEKGSFTGAVTQHKGKFEMADKGTIFLDEIGDMTLNAQRKLLRVLQEKQFERVGGSQSIKVDCRVVAATNRTLREDVAAGRFREDLYYRLAVVELHLPPLRERKSDIPDLVAHFLQKHRYGADSPPARIAEEAMTALMDHDWPGNVRQLEGTIQRAVVMARGEVITGQHLALDAGPEPSFIDVNQKLQVGESLPQVMAELERKMLSRALERTQGNHHAAAQLLGIDVSTFNAKLEQHGIAPIPVTS
ncbi:MAG: sigma-54-dependent transcriptional regulator [Chloroflexota bacterium]